jgi:hypothetical protein
VPSSANIIRATKQNKIRWAEKIKNVYNILLANLKGRDHLEGLAIDGRIR